MIYLNLSYGQQASRKTREKIWVNEAEWQEDICGCCNDMGSCMLYLI